MVDVVLWAGIIAFLALFVYCVVTSLNAHYGRHDGRYCGDVPRFAGVLGGVHRGEYVENPEWRMPRPRWRKPGWQIKDGYLEWGGSVHIGNVAHQSEVATLTLTPTGGLTEMPAITLPQGSLGPDEALSEEQRIRDIVNAELAATPIYTGVKYGRVGSWGDVTIDRTDTVAVRPVVEDGSS